MKIIFIVGMPGSGKSVFKEKANEMNIPVFSSGDIIREEIKKRKMEYNENNDLEIARWFNEDGREEHGEQPAHVYSNPDYQGV